MTRGSTDIIEDLRKEHDALYVRLFDHRARKKSGLESTKDHEALTRQVNTLLDKLEKIGPEIRLLDDYTWLINASLQWQAFAALLNINRKIKIPEPPDDGLWAPTQRLGKDDVDHWLASRERDICRLRHLEKFLWQIRHVVPDSSDAYIAKVYFAKDTLNGADSSTEQDSDGSKQRLDLVEKVPPSAYNYLEQVWFRDVIMVDAYLIWETRGRRQGVACRASGTRLS